MSNDKIISLIIAGDAIAEECENFQGTWRLIDEWKSAKKYITTMNNNEWQPIETAPKNDLFLITFYHTDDETKYLYRKITYWSDAEKGWDGMATSIRNKQIVPTHWMPLPKPPML